MLDMKVEIEKILKGSLDSISSPSVKIQIMGKKVWLRRFQQIFCIQKFVDNILQCFAFTLFMPMVMR